MADRCMDCGESSGILVSHDVDGEPVLRWLCLPCADEWRHPTVTGEDE